MRVLMRLLSIGAYVLALVAFVQAFNGRNSWWVVIAWAALGIMFGFFARVSKPGKSGQLSNAIQQAGFEKRSSLPEVKALLQQGANPNGVVQGETALTTACIWGDVAVVEALLDAGANPNSSECVHVAANNNYSEIIRLLVSRGAEIDARDEFGRTPLLFAAELGRVDAIRELVALGANQGAKNTDGHTPLLTALNAYQKWTSSDFLGQDTKSVEQFRESVEILQSASYR